MIYYVYERATGRFVGSGTPYIDNETHASTTVAPLPEPPVRHELFFNEQEQRWEWRLVEEGS